MHIGECTSPCPKSITPQHNTSSAHISSFSSYCQSLRYFPPLPVLLISKQSIFADISCFFAPFGIE